MLIHSLLPLPAVLTFYCRIRLAWMDKGFLQFNDIKQPHNQSNSSQDAIAIASIERISH